MWLPMTLRSCFISRKIYVITILALSEIYITTSFEMLEGWIVKSDFTWYNKEQIKWPARNFKSKSII